jgi:hypothetical protein
MEKEFVPYELALRMKALGFDEPCFGFYYRKEIDLFESCKIQERTNSSYVKEFMDKEDCVAPLFQQAFRWFREKYNIYAVPMPFSGKNAFYIQVSGKGALKFDYDTYEEAELGCLIFLIVESKLK